MGTKEIKRYCAVKEDAERLLETAINKLGLSARAYSRVLKVGRTIADLAGTENIEASHIAEAIQYRSLDRRMCGDVSCDLVTSKFETPRAPPKTFYASILQKLCGELF